MVFFAMLGGTVLALQRRGGRGVGGNQVFPSLNGDVNAHPEGQPGVVQVCQRRSLRIFRVSGL
jgi:hypothetical protein